MDVGEAIRARRSVGAFSDRSVPRATVVELIEAATWAPTHHLTQPWRFTVLAGAARAALAEAIVAADPAAGVARTAGAKLTRAPVCIVVGQHVPPDADPVLEREDYAACACAVQNLMLAAQAAGLASKWSTGALAESAAAKRHLGLAPGDRIVGYVYLGYGVVPAADGQRAAPPVEWRGL
jgi:nitroreductase